VLKESLMAAYFTDGENIADPAVLYERAVTAGVSSADARRVVDSDEGLEAVAVGLQRAADLGISSVPTYVFDGQWAVPGAQDPAFFERALRRLAERAAQPSRS
jgi:predicted DsbA family dithiol-disulfide isomerase